MYNLPALYHQRTAIIIIIYIYFSIIIFVLGKVFGQLVRIHTPKLYSVLLLFCILTHWQWREQWHSIDLLRTASVSFATWPLYCIVLFVVSIWESSLLCDVSRMVAASARFFFSWHSLHIHMSIHYLYKYIYISTYIQFYFFRFCSTDLSISLPHLRICPGHSTISHDIMIH